VSIGAFDTIDCHFQGLNEDAFFLTKDTSSHGAYVTTSFKKNDIGTIHSNCASVMIAMVVPLGE